MNKIFDKNKLNGLNDIVFKAIMYPKIHIMKSILECILDTKLEKIRYLGEELPVSQFLEKRKRLDAFVMDIDSYFDIEVSTKFTKYISWRNYAYASQVYLKTVKRSSTYKEYKHTYLINIIGNKKGKIPIRTERHVDEINELMTNVITEIQVNIEYFMKEYYNKGNQELINKYKYIIMLGLNLEELKEFKERYGDEIVEEYVKKFEEITSDEEILPLFTKEEERQLEINSARDEGIEQGIEKGIKKGIEQGIELGQEQGRSSEKIDLASKMIQEKIPLDKVSSITGLSINKLRML